MKKTNNAILVLTIAIDLIYLIMFIINKDLVKILTSLSLIPIVLLPNILKDKLSEEIKFIYILLVIALLLIGSIMNFYNIFKYYDSITHFLTGLFAPFFSLTILRMLNKYNKKDVAFTILFILSMTMLIASVWEIFEFICSNIFNEDIQKVLITGVNDTMKDIILALLGSILFIIWYVFKIKVNDKTINKIIYKY